IATFHLSPFGAPGGPTLVALALSLLELGRCKGRSGVNARSTRACRNVCLAEERSDLRAKLLGKIPYAVQARKRIAQLRLLFSRQDEAGAGAGHARRGRDEQLPNGTVLVIECRQSSPPAGRPRL